MKLLVFAVCVLACLILANGKPCRGDTCGYHYNKKRQISDGGGYNSQVGSHAEYVSSNANAVDRGTGRMDGSDSVGDISGESGDKEGGGGTMYGGGAMYGGGGRYGGGDMYGGGRYNGYNGYRRNKYCPSCHIENIGVGRPNFNTINIIRTSTPKQ